MTRRYFGCPTMLNKMPCWQGEPRETAVNLDKLSVVQ